MALSPKQESILAYIDSFMAENGYPPTVRDIQNGCDLSSTSVVDYNLRALDRLGYLRRTREVSRGIELSRRSKAGAARIPIVGMIAAGEPLSVPTLDPRTLDEGDKVRLQPENKDMEPIYVDARDIQVHGKVIGLIRRYF